MVEVIKVYTGPRGAQGDPGPPGKTILGGALQTYVFNSAVRAPPPVPGHFRINMTDQTLATIMWLHCVNDDGVDIKTYITQRLKAGDTLYAQDRDEASKWQLYEVSGAFTDNGDYVTVPIVWRAGGSPLTHDERIILTREVAAPFVNITVGPTPPDLPAINDVWIDTTAATAVKTWRGSEWL